MKSNKKRLQSLTDLSNFEPSPKRSRNLDGTSSAPVPVEDSPSLITRFWKRVVNRVSTPRGRKTSPKRALLMRQVGGGLSSLPVLTPSAPPPPRPTLPIPSRTSPPPPTRKSTFLDLLTLQPSKDPFTSRKSSMVLPPVSLAFRPAASVYVTPAPARREEETDETRWHKQESDWRWEVANAKSAGQPGPARPTSGWTKKRPMGSVKHKDALRDRDQGRLTSLGAAVSEMGVDEYRLKIKQEMALEAALEAFEPTPKITLGRSNSRTSIGSKRRSEDRITETRNLSLATAPPQSLEHWTKMKAALEAEDKAMEARERRVRKFPKRLSQADQDIVDDVLSSSRFVSTLPGAEVSSKDIRKLKGLQWLNDEVITFYSIMINLRSRLAEASPEGMGDMKKVYSFTSFFYAKFAAAGHAGVKTWTRKVDLFERDIVIVPINLGNSHWVCAAINIAQKRFEYYDSLGNRNPSVYKRLRTYLAAEHLAKRKTELDLSNWVDYWDEDVPQQDNSCDCGIFTCQFMETLSRNVDGFDFSQDQMPYFRNKMVLEIKTKEIIREPMS